MGVLILGFRVYDSPWFFVGSAGMGFWNYQKGTLRDCHRDPFPYSLLRTREIIRMPFFPLCDFKEKEPNKKKGKRVLLENLSGGWRVQSCGSEVGDFLGFFLGFRVKGIRVWGSGLRAKGFGIRA